MLQYCDTTARNAIVKSRKAASKFAVTNIY